MELVIRISDELYRDIQKRSTEIQAEGYVLENAILNGKPLPKGHGDLIDRNKLRKHERSVNDGNVTWLMDVYLPEEIDNAHVIIEKAESEESDGDSY